MDNIFDKIKGKAEDVVEEHGDRIRGGLEKAGEFVDQKTGGKYHDKIDKGVDAAKGQLNKLDRGHRPEPPREGPGFVPGDAEARGETGPNDPAGG